MLFLTKDKYNWKTLKVLHVNFNISFIIYHFYKTIRFTTKNKEGASYNNQNQTIEHIWLS